MIAIIRDSPFGLFYYWQKPVAMAKALGSFSGVHRRFERLGRWRGAEVVDDYAHHPTEVSATLEAARAAFPGRSIHVVLTMTYRVPLPEATDDKLEERLADFLEHDSVTTARKKKNRAVEIDLRPWVSDLHRQDNLLWMKMHSGSALFLAAYLLKKDVEEVRTMGICKTAIELKNVEIKVD